MRQGLPSCKGLIAYDAETLVSAHVSGLVAALNCFASLAGAGIVSVCDGMREHDALFSQARSVAEGILATVALMQDSRLPCFGRGAPVPNLRKRFHLDMTEAKAAAFMRSTILDAYDKVRLLTALLFCLAAYIS